jgi:hypothetical protein
MVVGYGQLEKKADKETTTTTRQSIENEVGNIWLEGLPSELQHHLQLSC